MSALTACSSKKKPRLASELPVASTEQPQAREQTGSFFSARVQAISRRNPILTLKFSDGKVAKIRCSQAAGNFGQIIPGETIQATFDDTVEVFPASADGKPLWSEIQVIRKPPRGIRPGAAIVRPYEYMATVQSIDYGTRQIVLKGRDGKSVRITANASVKRLNEISVGALVIARFTEARAIRVTSAEQSGFNRQRPPR